MLLFEQYKKETKVLTLMYLISCWLRTGRFQGRGTTVPALMYLICCWLRTGRFQGRMTTVPALM
jgi:hypothetical protein